MVKPHYNYPLFSSVQFSSDAQSCLTLWDPVNHSTPGLPVHHQLPEFTQTHVHRVGDAIQPSHPLSSPSPPALDPSQHQGLFEWVNSLLGPLKSASGLSLGHAFASWTLLVCSFKFPNLWCEVLVIILILCVYSILGCSESSLPCGFSLVAASGGCPSRRGPGFSLWWPLLLQSTGPRHTAQ